MDEKAGLGGRYDLTAWRRQGVLSLVWHQEGCKLDPTALTVQIRVRDELQVLPPSLPSPRFLHPFLHLQTIRSLRLQKPAESGKTERAERNPPPCSVPSADPLED